MECTNGWATYKELTPAGFKPGIPVVRVWACLPGEGFGANKWPQGSHGYIGPCEVLNETYLLNSAGNQPPRPHSISEFRGHSSLTDVLSWHSVHWCLWSWLVWAWDLAARPDTQFSTSVCKCLPSLLISLPFVKSLKKHLDDRPWAPSNSANCCKVACWSETLSSSSDKSTNDYWGGLGMGCLPLDLSSLLHWFHAGYQMWKFGEGWK